MYISLIYHFMTRNCKFYISEFEKKFRIVRVKVAIMLKNYVAETGFYFLSSRNFEVDQKSESKLSKDKNAFYF